MNILWYLPANFCACKKRKKKVGADSESGTWTAEGMFCKMAAKRELSIIYDWGDRRIFLCTYEGYEGVRLLRTSFSQWRFSDQVNQHGCQLPARLVLRLHSEETCSKWGKLGAGNSEEFYFVYCLVFRSFVNVHQRTRRYLMPPMQRFHLIIL